MDRTAAGQGMRGLFVTGTDTGIGKTRVTAGLVRALNARGCRAAGLKPVVSGVLPAAQLADRQGDTGRWWEDLDALAQAGGPAMSDEARAVMRLDVPASPHFAAEQQGLAIRMEDLLDGVRGTVGATALEFAVIEGVGGFCVPLGPGLDMAQFAQALGLPVLLVVGLRLGCINHALLTAEAIRSRGLALAGWVANGGIDVHYAFGPETIATLEERLALPCSARIGVLPPADAESVRSAAGRAALRQALELQIGVVAEALAEFTAGLWPGFEVEG